MIEIEGRAPHPISGTITYATQPIATVWRKSSSQSIDFSANAGWHGSKGFRAYDHHFIPRNHKYDSKFDRHVGRKLSFGV